jgi:hypothetical protein
MDDCRSVAILDLRYTDIMFLAYAEVCVVDDDCGSSNGYRWSVLVEFFFVLTTSSRSPGPLGRRDRFSWHLDHPQSLTVEKPIYWSKVGLT